MTDQDKYTFLKELINKCIKEKSVVNNRFIIPYLKEQKSIISSRVGELKLNKKEDK